MSTFYEEGRYACEVTQQAMTEAGTGTPQFVLKLRVMAHENGENVARQYERTSYRAITDKTMQYFKRDLEALGFDGPSLKLLDPNNQAHISLVGKQCFFDCKHETGQDGEPREKWGVAWVSKESSPIEGKAIDGVTYRKLDALFGASNGKKVISNPAPSRKVAPSQHETITDEDFPF